MPTHTSDSLVPDQGHVILCQEQAIRRSWHQDEWWFSVVDVCAVLTGGVDAQTIKAKLPRKGKKS